MISRDKQILTQRLPYLSCLRSPMFWFSTSRTRWTKRVSKALTPALSLLTSKASKKEWKKKMLSDFKDLKYSRNVCFRDEQHSLVPVIFMHIKTVCLLNDVNPDRHGTHPQRSYQNLFKIVFLYSSSFSHRKYIKCMGTHTNISLSSYLPP